MLANEINGGWYGLIGQHKASGVYSDTATLRSHHFNWYWLNRQAVIFLLADHTDLRKDMIAESRRARIWVELFWWGDRSSWQGMDLDPEVKKRLEEKGIPPGGSNLKGKDWFDMAEDPIVMQNVKNDIKWQLDTIAQRVGINTIHGVILSEEEPNCGIRNLRFLDGAVEQKKKLRYQNREEAREVLARAHNELYEYVKSLYPGVRVSPGFYPAWVKPGTLKYDAVVMDNYPGLGQEGKNMNAWLRAYGSETEQYVLLWGYGNLDSKVELARFEKVVGLHLQHGIRNLGFFNPRFSLLDPVFRLLDTRGVGSYAPYDMTEHRATVSGLMEGTRQMVDELRKIKGLDIPQLPEVEMSKPSTRESLCALADYVYKYRRAALDAAYEKMSEIKQWMDFNQLIQLAHAEEWIHDDLVMEYSAIVRQGRKWESLSQEFRTLAKFYGEILPMEQKIRAHAVSVAGSLSKTAEGDSNIRPFLEKAAEDLKTGSYSSACGRLVELQKRLFCNQTEKSWQVSLVLRNPYGCPQGVDVILAADFGGGSQRVIYHDTPFIAAKEQTIELNFILSARPQALTLATGSWAGHLAVRKLQAFNSRAILAAKLAEEDHAKGIHEYMKNPDAGFELSPWGSASHVKLTFPTK
ncbi:MAG: hypothetical protein PHV34_01355 [Verrucomicrobiae bacterium]|nr:hypothetical protein [Verrucomicrobiae bacterium]